MSGSPAVNTFNSAAHGVTQSSKRKSPPPFSIRFTWEERERLDRDAGKIALSAYVRHKLFDGETVSRKPQYTQKQRQPGMDHATLARLLGMLGKSELGTSMIALALAAQSGSLPVSEELTEKLDTACDDIHAMRMALIMALNVKPEAGR